MNGKWRRYEILLPQRFNDGGAVPKAWLGEAQNEVVNQFGAASYESHRVEGHWRFRGTEYRDILARLIVEVPDTRRNRQWLKKFQVKWKKRLKQIELRMISYRINLE